MITADRRPSSKETRQQPLLNRAIKIDHIDLTEDLVAYYADLPRFAETESRPKSPEEPWPLKEKADVFSGVRQRGSLPIAAFPGFTIRRDRAASGSWMSSIAGSLGGSIEEKDWIEVKIPTAETYGLPSLLATGRLELYCQDPFKPNVCTDETLRNHLSYVTSGMRDTAIDPKTGRLRYLIDVEIALVNRVYLTRSIEQSRRLGRSQAAALKAIGDAATRIKNAGAPNGTGSPPSGDSSSTHNDLKDLISQLNDSIPGGLASVSSDSDSTFELKQTFQRPIVIGYRAVRRSFDYNLDRQNLREGQLETENGGAK